MLRELSRGIYSVRSFYRIFQSNFNTLFRWNSPRFSLQPVELFAHRKWIARVCSVCTSSIRRRCKCLLRPNLDHLVDISIKETWKNSGWKPPLLWWNLTWILIETSFRISRSRYHTNAPIKSVSHNNFESCFSVAVCCPSELPSTLSARGKYQCIQI